MPLRPAKGNMYQFLNDYPNKGDRNGYTWNTIKGECYHDCSCCYMKKFKLNPVKLDEKEFKTDLGKNNFIFIGSSCDMWTNNIPNYWILQTLDYCKKYENKYLFQSKNPVRISMLKNEIPDNSVIGTTIESNWTYHDIMGNTPSVEERAVEMEYLSGHFETMVTLEPILDFHVPYLINLIKMCNPKWINIGADSKGHKLPEPTTEKIYRLIDELEKNNFEIKVKSNLERLLK